ncbi:MAG: hypothetical protein IAF08_16295 [Rhizobacter sp.]|nr:hypothetical protein [Chlorobiales bacterium]
MGKQAKRKTESAPKAKLSFEVIEGEALNSNQADAIAGLIAKMIYDDIKARRKSALQSETPESEKEQQKCQPEADEPLAQKQSKNKEERRQ